jgi:hypothetical protein
MEGTKSPFAGEQRAERLLEQGTFRNAGPRGGPLFSK